MLLPANDPKLRSWIPITSDSDFPIQNIPFGIISHQHVPWQCPAVRIGDHVVDLRALSELGFLRINGIDPGTFAATKLNDLLAHGRKDGRAVRDRVSELLRSDNPELRDNAEAKEKCIKPIGSVSVNLPVDIGDYTDFYSSRQHAYNVGVMFRDPANALLPNWPHMPVGYHGRASSIVVSGTPIRRPMGQYKPSPDAPPEFGPTRQLDFELEVAFITCQGNALGTRIAVGDAEEDIFGLVLFNDWSARDIQAWEYVPLGPFLGKNFGSSMSPWVVTLDALEPFRIPSPKQEPEVLPYLKGPANMHFEIALEVGIVPESGEESIVSRSNFKHMYWSMAQQLAHHTVNGCNVRPGDVMASGTISGDAPDSYGSMLELSWKGTKPVKLDDGSERKFIQDGDTVVLRGHCEKDGVRIGFGEVESKVLPAR